HAPCETRRWPRTVNQSGWTTRPKTWNARSATRDRPKLTPMPQAPYQSVLSKVRCFEVASRPQEIIERGSMTRKPRLCDFIKHDDLRHAPLIRRPYDDWSSLRPALTVRSGPRTLHRAGTPLT